MKILTVDNSTGSKFYRLIPQIKWMAEHGHEVRMVANNDPEFDQAVNWCDLVIFQMVFSPETVADCKKLGKKVVFECDDLIHDVPKSHYAYEETAGWRNKIKWWWKIYRTFRNCDGFISTNRNLDKIYGWMARKSLVFDNYCDLAHWLKEPKTNQSETKIRLLWAGSTSHMGDLQAFKPVLKTILDKYPQVQFVYIGMGGTTSNDLYSQFIYGDDFFSDFPAERRESILPVSANVWPYILSSLQADIAIAPLENNYFNKFKSCCKWLEYSVNGIPGVYARWHYKQVVANGHTGYLADTKEEWVKEISKLIESADERKKIGEAARNEVLKNHRIDLHLNRWQEFIESL